MSTSSDGSKHRERLTRQRGRVDLERSRQQPSVGRDALTLGDQQDVARHEVARFHEGASVAYHGGVLRQVLPERLDGPLGLLYLREDANARVRQ